MLAAVEPDIVIVPVQTDLHFPLAMRVLDSPAPVTWTSRSR